MYVDCSLEQVTRTRVYTTDIGLWNDIGKAHKEYFSEIRPAFTLVEVKRLKIPKALVEIEFTGIL